MEHLIIKSGKYLFTLSIIFLLQSCYYDNNEDLYPQAPTCDTTNVTFSNTIFPLINSNCTAHHSGGAPSGNVLLTNYDGISAVAKDGRLLSVIRHEEGWPPMPQGGGKLPECDIKKIEVWVNEGAANN